MITASVIEDVMQSLLPNVSAAHRMTSSAGAPASDWAASSATRSIAALTGSPLLGSSARLCARTSCRPTLFRPGGQRAAPDVILAGLPLADPPLRRWRRVSRRLVLAIAPGAAGAVPVQVSTAGEADHDGDLPVFARVYRAGH